MTNTDLIKQGDEDNRKLYFCWFLVDWCNYACSYCCTADGQNNQFNKNPNPSIHKLVLTKLKKIKDPFLLMLVGGEPTLHPHIDEIIYEAAKIENCELQIYTNLSRSLQFHADLLDNHDNLQMTASYHPEYHNLEFVEKAIALKDKKFAIHICLSDQKEDWDKTRWMINTLTDAGLTVYFQHLYSANERDINYSQEFYDTFGEEYSTQAIEENFTATYYYANGNTQTLTPSEIYEQRLDSFKGWKCRAQMFNIDINGDIYNYCNRNIKLPLVITEEDTHQYITCPVNTCTCDQMFQFPKVPK